LCKIFKPFLGEILKLFFKYLPFDDLLLNALDFVALENEAEALENNFLLFFNKYFNSFLKKRKGN